MNPNVPERIKLNHNVPEHIKMNAATYQNVLK